jgi:hypothetical protein
MVSDPTISKDLMKNFEDKTGYKWVNNLSDDAKQKVLSAALDEKNDGNFSSIVTELSNTND